MNYQQTATEARLKILELIYKAQTSHIGSNFSIIDVMTVLYEKADLSRDKIILSAGWKAASLYYFLWRKGRITEEELNSYCQPGSKFIGLSEPVIPDISFAGGSMGMGLPAGVGFALAKKLKKEEGKIYVLMSDGELQCGTTWEAAMIASQHNLDNLLVIVDYNKLQAMGETNQILNIEPLKAKWRAFGWRPAEVDGHNHGFIKRILNSNTLHKGHPAIIIANTTKGKGVSFMEDNNEWHYRAPEIEEYQLALKQLNSKT